MAKLRLNNNLSLNEMVVYFQKWWKTSSRAITNNSSQICKVSQRLEKHIFGVLEDEYRCFRVTRSEKFCKNQIDIVFFVIQEQLFKMNFHEELRVMLGEFDSEVISLRLLFS
jgi:hypothetical protein